MEKRLADFRSLKAARQGPSSKSKAVKFGPKLLDEDAEQVTKRFTEDEKATERYSSDDEKKFNETMAKQRENIDAKHSEKLSFLDKHIEKALKFILWLCLLGFFIQIGFGAVYFVVSLTYIMYASMRSGSKQSGPSAYSVFNEGCERIHGTFTAEQFENQLRHGATSSR